MIINIPLNIDDELWASSLARDYESKVIEKLTEEVRKCITEQDSYSFYSRDRSFNRGLTSWVSVKIDDILKEHKAEIIEAASDKLAERLSKTKATKEIVAKMKEEDFETRREEKSEQATTD